MRKKLNRIVKVVKSLWLSLASSFTLNFIALGVLLVLIVFNIGNIWFWKVCAVFFCMNALFLNSNYFRYIRHKVK